MFVLGVVSKDKKAKCRTIKTKIEVRSTREHKKKIPPAACMSVCYECSALSGRELCVGLITCLGEPYRLVSLCMIQKAEK